MIFGQDIGERIAARVRRPFPLVASDGDFFFDSRDVELHLKAIAAGFQDDLSDILRIKAGGFNVQLIASHGEFCE